MINKCGCGGRVSFDPAFRRYSFVVLASGGSLEVSQDTDPLVAHFVCLGCGRKFEQRRRRAVAVYGCLCPPWRPRKVA